MKAWYGNSMSKPTVVLYYSGTGITQRAAQPVGGQPIDQYDGESPYLLFVPSYGAPKTGNYIPPAVQRFLTTYGNNIVGVVGIGNLTFGEDYCKAATEISLYYRVPIIARIDLVPTPNDYKAINQFLGKDTPSHTSSSPSASDS